MDRKRKTDQYENSGDVVPDADAAGKFSPAANALLSMIANGNDIRAAAAIGIGVMEKQDSFARKKLPDYPLKLDAVRLKQLQAIDYKQEKLSKQVKVRYKEVKMDYREKIQPLYQRRYEIVAGTAENGKGYRVPDFWLSALVAIPEMSDSIMKQDEQALKYLMNINCHKTKAPEKSLKLEFIFDRNNPFFENSVLTKVIYWKKDGCNDRTEGTRIVWKKGRCLTHGYGRLKDGRKVKLWFKSFFDFFYSSDEHTEEDRIKTMIYDTRIAVRIHDKILPHAFALYMDAKVSGKV